MSNIYDLDEIFLSEHDPVVSAARPAWAEERPDHIVGTNREGEIEVHYISPDLLDGGGVTAQLFTETTYDPETQQVRPKAPVLSVGIGKADLINFATPEEARATARALTLAAEKFEELR